MCVRNILRNMDRGDNTESPRERDCGLQCTCRMFTKENDIYCRRHGFQRRNFCRDCEYRD